MGTKWATRFWREEKNVFQMVEMELKDFKKDLQKATLLNS